MDNDLCAKFYGVNMDYSSCLKKMNELHRKVAQREMHHHLMLLEHEPVITYTRQHMLKNIKTSQVEVLNDGIALCLADRGGDITFHGPGQLIGYPLFYLQKQNVVDFVRELENALLQACFFLKINNATTLTGYTGIWVDEKKLIAIGVGLKNKTTKHGFSFNLSIDYEPFLKHITPCGLKEKGITTLEIELLKKGLEMPKYSDIVEIVTSCIAQEFFHGRKHHHAPIG